MSRTLVDVIVTSRRLAGVERLSSVGPHHGSVSVVRNTIIGNIIREGVASYVIGRRLCMIDRRRHVGVGEEKMRILLLWGCGWGRVGSVGHC